MTRGEAERLFLDVSAGNLEDVVGLLAVGGVGIVVDKRVVFIDHFGVSVGFFRLRSRVLPDIWL